MQNSGESLLLEKCKNKQALNDKLEKRLFSLAATFGYSKFQDKVRRSANLRMLASALAGAFPHEYESADKLVLTKGRGGKLYNACKYRVEQNQELNRSEEALKPLEEDSTLDDNALNAIVESLRSMKSTEKVAIYDGLEKTLKLRHKILKNGTTQAKSRLIFSFFLVNPDYINYDYALLYPGKESQMMENWAPIAESLAAFERTFKVPAKINMLEVPSAVEPYVSLLRLVGVNSVGKTKSTEPRDTFKRAFSRILEFHQLNTPIEDIKSSTNNTEPFIVALYSENKSTISQFLIIIQSNTITLKPLTSFETTFSIYFKIFTIFNIPPPASLKRFFQFFVQHIFNIQENRDLKSDQLHSRIQKFINTKVQENSVNESQKEE